VFILKVGAGYLSFNYHHIYFAGGDGNIYLNGGRNLIDYSDGNPITYFKLFTNQNRQSPEWKETYDRIIYWDPVDGAELIDDNRTAIRVNSLVSLISFRSIALHLIILIFLSLIGLMALYKTFRKWFKHIYPPAIFLAVFLTPSIIFWTSGILKETHTILFLGLFLLQLSVFLEHKTISSFFLTLLLSILILLSRTYLAAALFIPVTFLVISSNFKSNKLLKPIGLTFLVTLLIILLLNVNGINLYQILAAKQSSFNIIGQNADSFFNVSEINQPFDLIKYLPISLINVFIQPQLFSFNSWLYIFPLIENIDIFTMAIIAFIYYKSPARQERKYLLFILMVWIIGGWLIGLTVPIQGAIARYKSIFMPFLLMSIFAITDWQKLKIKYLKGD
jgi:hypothetical protein